MPAYRFRFEQILRLRLHYENEVREQLARKDQQIAAEQQKLEAVRRELEQGLIDKADDLAAGRLDRVALYAAYFRRLHNAIVWHQDEIERFQKQRAKIVEDLMVKMRERKIMEKLKERKAAQHARHELKRDQKRLDEFANRPSQFATGSESEPDPGGFGV